MAEKTFFRNASEGQMTLKDIFSDISRKHTPDETARIFIAGTSLTTPSETEMLAVWQKPFLFARFFVVCTVMMAIFLGFSFLHPGGLFYLMICLSVFVSVTLLLLVWEMNIPRNISLYEILLIVGVGGILSLVATMLLAIVDPTSGAIWAPLTEEPAKLIIIYLILRKKNYKFTLNGILIGVAVGTGFAVFENLWYSYRALMSNGISGAVIQAAVRALTDIPGHGLYAGLYGGALVMVKKEEMVDVKHLLNVNFLKYFGMAFLIHMLNNSGFSNNLIVITVVMTTIIIVCFLPMLRKGVNEIVLYVMALNGGRLTQAVERGNGAVHQGSPSPLPAPGRPCVVTLQILTGPDIGKSCRLQPGQSFTFGRSSRGLNLQSCIKVSSRHCTVELRGSTVLVTDLGSTNGTFVGSQRLRPNEPTVVSGGSIISLGSPECSFRVNVQ